MAKRKYKPFCCLFLFVSIEFMNIPLPLFPDEHVLGWCGRIRFFNHFPDSDCVFCEIRMLRGIDKNSSFQVNKVNLLARESGLKDADFVFKHTMFPYLRAFDLEGFYELRFDAYRLGRLRNIGIAGWKNKAWYCQECAREDLHEFGMPFWRRLHQIPAVGWCLKHGRRLVGVEGKYAFDKPPKPIDCESVGDVSSKDFSAVHSVLHNFAVIAGYLLHRSCPLDFRVVRWLLIRKAVEGGFFDKKQGKVNVYEAVRARGASHLLKYFQLALGDFNLDAVFQRSESQRPTELYVIALSVIFESAEEALIRLDSLEEVRAKTYMDSQKYGEEFWLDDWVLDSYIRHGGVYKLEGEGFDLEWSQASHFWRLYGLPAHADEDGASLNALVSFFSGDSLLDACAKHGASIINVECILRVAGNRLADSLHRNIPKFPHNRHSAENLLLNEARLQSRLLTASP